MAMKRGIIFTAVTAILVSGTIYLTSFKGADQPDVKSYTLIEVYEVPSYTGKGIYIHKGESAKVEYIPFKEFKADNHDENGEIIVNTVNRMVREGYHIEHVTSGVAESGMITKIFMHQ